MSISRKALCVAYGLIALLALVGTWGNNVAYLSLGFVDANMTFWRETLVNPASRSITVDLFFLGLAMFVWMVLEAREPASAAGTLSAPDIIGLVLVTGAIAIYTAITLST